MKQIKEPISFGFGATGEKRLRLYRERSRSKGYKNLSTYVVALLKREAVAERRRKASNRAVALPKVAAPV